METTRYRTSCASPLLHEIPEGSIYLVEERDEGLLVVLIFLTCWLELHVCNLLDHVLHGVVDGAPHDLVLSLELGHGLLCRLVEANNDLHHADGLGERAHEVVLCETILLQEILPDNLGDLQRALLVLRQRILADQLHDLLKVILLLQNLLHLLLEHT